MSLYAPKIPTTVIPRPNRAAACSLNRAHPINTPPDSAPLVSGSHKSATSGRPRADRHAPQHDYYAITAAFKPPPPYQFFPLTGARTVTALPSYTKLRRAILGEVRRLGLARRVEAHRDRALRRHAGIARPRARRSSACRRLSFQRDRHAGELALLVAGAHAVILVEREAAVRAGEDVRARSAPSGCSPVVLHRRARSARSRRRGRTAACAHSGAAAVIVWPPV